MPENKGINTQLAHLGNNPLENQGFINPPIVRGSTVLFPDAQTMKTRAQKYTYGTKGTPTTDALCNAISQLEGANGTMLMPSGLAAITVPLTIFAKQGGHILIVDSLYTPIRTFCNGILKRLGLEIEYFSIHTKIDDFKKLIKNNTCILMLESPASNSFEVMEIKQFANAAHKQNPDCVVMMDNTWGSPLLFKPLEHEVDISIQALTKYVSGHSDVLMGSAAANTKHFPTLKQGQLEMGICVSSDDAYLALRGLRTMNIRLQQQAKSAMEICNWLQQQKQVGEILYPALPSSPYYEMWQKQYKGANGLFSFVLKQANEKQAMQFLDALELHGLGFSWAGYESLALAPDFSDRVFDKPNVDGTIIRLQVGLEDVADIIADLQKGFAAI